MQTKSQIQQLLTAAGVAPNKRLGQHFLIDLTLMKLLIEAAHLTRHDIALEVGCGTGSFTQALSESASAVIAVEYDSTLAAIAEAQLSKAQNVEVINVDILESKHKINSDVVKSTETAASQCQGRLVLVANLPYNIAAPLMMNLIAGPVIADGMYVTIQKEVAQKMVATPGASDYGSLSIFMAATGRPKIIRNLAPSVFWPKPQVDSAMITFERIQKKADRIHDMKIFSQVISLFFGHRRKMLQACVKFAENDLAGVHQWHNVFEQSCVEPQHRPEQLTPEQYISIANLCSEAIS